MATIKILVAVVVALAFPATTMAGTPGAVKTYSYASGQIDVTIPVVTPAVGPPYTQDIKVLTDTPEDLGVVDSCAGTPMAGMCNNIAAKILDVEYRVFVTGLGTGSGLGNTGHMKLINPADEGGSLFTTTAEALGADCGEGMQAISVDSFDGSPNLGSAWTLQVGSLATTTVLHCWSLTITYQEDPEGQLVPPKPTFTSCREKQPRIAKLAASGLTCAAAQRLAMNPKLRGKYRCAAHGMTTCTHRENPAVAFRYQHVPVVRRCGTEASTGLTKIVSFDATCVVAKQVARRAMKVPGGWSQVGVWKKLSVPPGWKCSYWTQPVRWHCNNGRGARVNFEPGAGF